MIHVPYQNMEVEQIYTQVLSEPGRSIAICSANAGEGVTSLTLALAQRNLLAGHSTLVVDLNLYRPALKSLLSIESASLNEMDGLSPVNIAGEMTRCIFAAPALLTVNQHPFVIMGITAPTRRENIIKLRQPGTLEQCIREWLKHYDTVIIDTSPLNRINAQNIPAERVASACDGALLVVLAGNTNEAMICTAVKKLTTSKAQLLGCVFNDRDNPSLKNELLREVHRIGKFSWLTRRLIKSINRNHLLTLEV